MTTEQARAAADRHAIVPLPPAIVERIAAGEVIERPASVVRELIDNALDAGATSVRVEVCEGGLRLIRVTDDGWGMAPEDLALACQPHTTSKVRALADLEHIATLGFRGEALASIAAAAELEITSACDARGMAATLTLAAEMPPSQQPASRSRGTTVTVRDLFQRIPARRATLRGHRAEATRALATVSAYALAHPGVRFALICDGALAFHTSGADTAAVVAAIYGTDIARSLLPLEPIELVDVSALGYIGARAFHYATRDHLYVSVNGRPVESGPLVAAAEAGYRPLLRKGRHPLLVVRIAADPACVDANIQPAKARVLLRQEGTLAAGLRRAVYHALATAPLSMAGALAPPLAPHVPRPLQLRLPAPRQRRGLRLPPRHLRGPTADDGQGDVTLPAMLPALEPLAQFDGTLIVAHSADGHLYLVDQHRAHERVLYEQLARQRATFAQRAADAEPAGDAPGQLLLEPLLVELTPLQAELLYPRLDELCALGLECQPFGGSVLLLRTLPHLAGGRQNPMSFARELVCAAAADAEDWLDHVCVSLACRSAIRRGQTLAPAEQRALLQDLRTVASAAACPHGSPLLLRYTRGALARAFDW